jgi:hypothetical protein
LVTASHGLYEDVGGGFGARRVVDVVDKHHNRGGGALKGAGGDGVGSEQGREVYFDPFVRNVGGAEGSQTVDGGCASYILTHSVFGGKGD